MNPSQLTEPLLAAIDAGDLETVTTLLDQGADINTRDSNNETLLMRAISARHTELVRLLLAHGAETYVMPSIDYHAPDEAIYRDYWKTLAQIASPIPLYLARLFLEAYSDTNGYKAFHRKNRSRPGNGLQHEGYFLVEEDANEIQFIWAVGPMSPAWCFDHEDIIIPFSDIDLDSLDW